MVQEVQAFVAIDLWKVRVQPAVATFRGDPKFRVLVLYAGVQPEGIGG
jgi:hypothetical protein